MDGIHDMGGMHGFGPVPVDQTAPGPDWGTRLQAVGMLSGGTRRAGIEAIPPDQYLAAGYHERWLLCGEQMLVDKGKVSPADLARWRDILADDPTAMPRTEDPERTARTETKVMSTPPLFPLTDQRFAVGDRVRVKAMRPERHHRCPRYVRGAGGVIEKVPGADYIPHLPQEPANTETIYTVRFDSVDLWGDRSEQGEPGYELYIDLWQNYLEPA